MFVGHDIMVLKLIPGVALKKETSGLEVVVVPRCDASEKSSKSIRVGW